MIHEIAPHRYDNAFLQSAPGEGDAALYYEKDTILLCQEGKGWRIPQFSDLTLEAAEGAERLFSIDGQGLTCSLACRRRCRAGSSPCKRCACCVNWPHGWALPV